MNKIFKLLISNNEADNLIAQELMIPSDENFDFLCDLIYLRFYTGNNNDMTFLKNYKKIRNQILDICGNGTLGSTWNFYNRVIPECEDHLLPFWSGGINSSHMRREDHAYTAEILNRLLNG